MKTNYLLLTFILSGLFILNLEAQYKGGTGAGFSLHIAGGGASLALPVELKDFYLKGKQHIVQIKWSTASETNNKKFILQRSTDNKNFAKIAEFDGAGNSNTVKNYDYKDELEIAGTYYYQLIQMDVNGKLSRSKVISYNFEDKVNSFKVYPNPGNGEKLFIEYNKLKEDESLKISIRDMFGKLMFTEFLNTATSALVIENLKLSDGIYSLEILNETNGNLINQLIQVRK